MKKDIEMENEKDNEIILNDSLDLYSLASSINSNISDMSRDYTLAKYDKNIRNSFTKFIVSQRKVARILKNYLLNYRLNDKEKEIINKIYKEIEMILLGEVDEYTIISRSFDGRVINSMLTKESDLINEYKMQMNNDNNKSLWQKIKGE